MRNLCKSLSDGCIGSCRKIIKNYPGDFLKVPGVILFKDKVFPESRDNFPWQSEVLDSLFLLPAEHARRTSISIAKHFGKELIIRKTMPVHKL